ncbi:MAG: hypothetical protein WA867_06895 [Candidatus Acidiferrales bacterium]
MKRPFEVTLLGWFFIAVGTFAAVYHLSTAALDRWMIVILLFEGVGILAGAFLLKGARWARWLALAWVAAHVVVGALNSLAEALPHLVLLVAIGYFLLGSPTAEYYRRSEME